MAIARADLGLHGAACQPHRKAAADPRRRRPVRCLCPQLSLRQPVHTTDPLEAHHRDLGHAITDLRRRLAHRQGRQPAAESVPAGRHLQRPHPGQADHAAGGRPDYEFLPPCGLLNPRRRDLLVPDLQPTDAEFRTLRAGGLPDLAAGRRLGFRALGRRAAGRNGCTDRSAEHACIQSGHGPSRTTGATQRDAVFGAHGRHR